MRKRTNNKARPKTNNKLFFLFFSNALQECFFRALGLRCNLTYPGPALLYPPSRFGVVAQLVRAPACHAGGRGFESRLSRHRNLPSSCVNERPEPTVKGLPAVSPSSN